MHDVFVKFALADGALRISGSLGSYLAACVANRACDVLRQRRVARSLNGMPAPKGTTVPELSDAVEDREAARHMARAGCGLPHERREALLLHVTADMRFLEIAEVQGVSLRTAQGRCRYAMKKLRSTLIRGMSHERTE